MPIVVGVILVCWVVGLFGYAAWMEFASAKRKPPKEYIEYSTAPSIADKWHDQELVGLCHVCGLEDAPIVHLLHGYTSMPACKYCMELKNLNYHLEWKTTRKGKRK